MKWCPKCKEFQGKVNRVFSVISVWDEDEGDYRYDPEDLYNADLVDKCVTCGSDLVEMPNAKAESDQAV